MCEGRGEEEGVIKAWSADGCSLWSLMKSCSPAEAPNYLYIKPSQPMGLEEKRATLTALPTQSGDASCPPLWGASNSNLFSLIYQTGKKNSTGKQKWLLTPLLSSVFVQWTFCLQKLDPDNHIIAKIIFQRYNLLLFIRKKRNPTVWVCI